MFCKYCGKEIKDGETHCFNCGAEIVQKNTKTKSKWPNTFLTVFFSLLTFFVPLVGIIMFFVNVKKLNIKIIIIGISALVGIAFLIFYYSHFTIVW